MSRETGQSSGEAHIRELIENRVKAVVAKDTNAAIAGHAPDIVMFAVIDPLAYVGADDARDRTDAWFASYDGAIGYEIRDVRVTAGEDVAFGLYLYRVSGKLTTGADIEMWVRATVCFEKRDGAWSLTHEHDSVPFDPETGQASLGLTP